MDSCARSVSETETCRVIFGVVLCVGDSLLTGARDEFGLSVPKLLGDELSKDSQNWIAVDECVAGETSGVLLRRLYKVVRSYPEATDVVVSVGTNDAKRKALPVSCFSRNYAEIVRTARVLKRHCYTCLIPARSGFGAPDYIDNNAITNYNKTIIKLSLRFPDTITAVDITSVSTRHRADGVHFNDRGNRWVAKEIASTIRAARS